MKQFLSILCLAGITSTSSIGYANEPLIWKGQAVLVIKSSKLKAFKKAVSKITAPTLKEKGCISYEGFQVFDEKGNPTNRFEFHELWVSKEAMMIDHKEKSPHMKLFFKEIKADTKNSYIEKFEVDGKYVRRVK